MTDTWGYKAAIRRDLFSLIPAHAGVIPARLYEVVLYSTYPRACGGDPSGFACDIDPDVLSPRMRG